LSIVLLMKYKQLIVKGMFLFLAIQFTLATAYAQVVSNSSQTQIDYQLPYPGMLPDNPLFFLKVIRDNLTAFFLSKPLDKAQFDLLQSDKNVQASYLLVTQEVGKTDLALQTFSQSQDELSQAIDQIASARKQGYNITEMYKKVNLSNEKHMQLLQSIGQQTGQKNTQTFQKELGREKSFTKKIDALR
jgi:hypothetical protein